MTGSVESLSSKAVDSAGNALSGAAAGASSYLKEALNSLKPNNTETTEDRRVRLRPYPGTEDYVYNIATGATTKTNLLNPRAKIGMMSVLAATNGMIFPTTPTITESHSVEYSSYDPVHSIARFNNYVRTQNVSLGVSGNFYVTNATEARYLMACIHFLRSVTKMDFGRESPHAGTPPPVLLFSGYGNYMFHDIPVIVKNINFNYRDDVDYIQVPLTGDDISDEYRSVAFFQKNTKERDKIWVPTEMMISVQLEQQTTGEYLTKEFSLSSFKRGDLLTKGGLI